jgi:hypothetical protein
MGARYHMSKAGATSLIQAKAQDLFAQGFAAHHAGQWHKAIDAYHAAIHLAPDQFQFHANLAAVLRDDGQYEAAAAAFARAKVLAPDIAQIFVASGMALHDAGMYQSALSDYARAARLMPGAVAIDWYASLTYLLTGDFQRGWAGYEARWQSGMVPPHAVPKPKWDKHAREKARVLVHCEQGFGDSIQFVRYLKPLADFGVQPILRAPKPLYRLFQSVEHVDQLLIDDQPLPEFDYQIPLMSLPQQFWHDVAYGSAAVPYLGAPVDLTQSWRQRLDLVSTGRPKIGLVWRGNKNHLADRGRSLTPRILARLVEAYPDCDFISLQKDATAQEISQFDGRLRDHFDQGQLLGDFADTAGIIANLDLLISADTAVAHLGGAMGCKTFVMIPYPPDWRWGISRSDSPWYPQMRLFRRQVDQTWDQVIDQIQQALAIWLDTRR